MARSENTPAAERPAERVDAQTAEQRELQAANESLSHALQWSFRLLSLIMLFVLAGFALSGFSTVESGERGVVMVFGRITGVVDEGLAYTWPYPVGDIQLIDARTQELTVENFWMYLLPEQRGKDLSEVKAPSKGLRLGVDGALFTGDRNLLHARLVCTYQIEDPVAYLESINEEDLQTQATLKDFIRSFVTDSAIRAAAVRTAEGIHTTANEEFSRQVKRGAQAKLNWLTASSEEIADLKAYLGELANRPGEVGRKAAAMRDHLRAGDVQSAEAVYTELDRLLNDATERQTLIAKALPLTTTRIRLESVSLTPSWPLSALPAYNRAQEAQSRLAAMKAKALADQKQILLGAAGPNYYKLVGYLAAPAETAAPEDGPYDLIGRYEQALDANDADRAAAVLDQIDTVLLANDTTGQAGKIISDAMASQTAFMEPIRSWGKRFEDLLPSYRLNGRILLPWLWTETEARVLTAGTNEKSLLNPGPDKTVLRINQDPTVVRQIESAELRGGSAPRGGKVSEGVSPGR